MLRRRGSFNIHAMLCGLLALVVVAGLIRLSSTVGIGTGSKHQLTFWNGFTGPDGIVMLKIIEEFNAKNPDVEVRMQRIPWATYYNKLTIAGSDGRGPDIFVLHADAVARVRRAGFVADVSDLYKSAIDPKDFDPYVIDYIRFDGKYQGVPLDIHPQGMFCNREMLKEAGLDGPPTNGEEFERAIKLTTREPGGAIKEKQWGFALTAWGNNFRSLVPQFGGRYLDEKGDSVVNSPENVKALEYLQGLTKDKIVPPPDNGLGWFGYRTKRVNMVWDGIYMLGDLLRVKDVDYVGAPIPQIGPKPGTVANSHVVCLKAGMSPDRQEAASRFVKYISDHSLEWAAAGQVPARVSVRKDPKFAEMQVQKAFSEQIPTMLYPPKTPVIFEFMLAMDQAVEAVVRGQATPKEALDKADTQAQEAIDRDRVEHPEKKP